MANSRHRRREGAARTAEAREPASKYRNPTGKPTFDKSTAFYRPTHHGLDRDANVVVVESAIDALAMAAAAASNDELSMFVPANTSGVTVSGLRAQTALALHPKPPVIALDGDRAGREGTDRWLRARCVERGWPALLTRLPEGIDPAEWLQHQGVSGLSAFDRRDCIGVNSDVNADAPMPQLTGRDLVRICFDQSGERVRHVLEMLTPLATRLREGAVRELIDQAERAMTVRGCGAGLRPHRRRNHHGPMALFDVTAYCTNWPALSVPAPVSRSSRTRR